MNKTLTFVIGGARSGKSAFAQRLAQEHGGDSVLYLATLRDTPETQNDLEMQRRIARHRAARPPSWHTLVVGDHSVASIVKVIQELAIGCVLLDCLSLYISGALFMSDSLPTDPEHQAEVETRALLNAYHAAAVPWIIVSNEVGLSVVPETPSARAYRDALGRANQYVAQLADEAYLLVAGLAMRLK